MTRTQTLTLKLQRGAYTEVEDTLKYIKQDINPFTAKGFPINE